MHVLGINSWLHDSAVALFREGELVAAIEEERWYRDDKHTSEFPRRSIEFCLRQAGGPAQIEHVAINLNTKAAYGDAGKMLARLDKANQRDAKHLRRSIKLSERGVRQTLRSKGTSGDFTFHEVAHHDAHAASTFFLSPYEEAAVLTLDGRGEWATTTSYHGRGNRLERVNTIGLPHSLGSVYAAVTEYLGFLRNNDEYKVMGLASYGDPSRFKAQMDRLVRPTEGGFEVNLEHFEEQARVLFAGEGLVKLFGQPRRVRESELEQVHKDLAAALQQRTEEIGLHLARQLHTRTEAKHLCMAGGVALNCVMNTRILAETEFESIYVQPAAYDAGGALGAAAWVNHQILGMPRTFVMNRPNFGPEYGDAEIEQVLSAGLLRYRKVEDPALAAAELIAEGKIVGWFQGRAEFGPRALGYRSILADPSQPHMQDHVNARVKHRESFRPFAPSTTLESFREVFDTEAEDPFMTTVIPVREEFRARLPAITHVDGTARMQTVRKELNPLYHRLISEVGRLRGLPIVLNTSFNVRGEPMVLSPKDALRCFFTTGLDHLVLGSFVVDK